MGEYTKARESADKADAEAAAQERMAQHALAKVQAWRASSPEQQEAAFAKIRAARGRTSDSAAMEALYMDGVKNGIKYGQIQTKRKAQFELLAERWLLSAHRDELCVQVLEAARRGEVSPLTAAEFAPIDRDLLAYETQHGALPRPERPEKVEPGLMQIVPAFVARHARAGIASGLRDQMFGRPVAMEVSQAPPGLLDRAIGRMFEPAVVKVKTFLADRDNDMEDEEVMELDPDSHLPVHIARLMPPRPQWAARTPPSTMHLIAQGAMDGFRRHIFG